ncbi:N-acetyltransferase [bacterium]|nr:MAG: N-acetyltransferase [bacterium]
MVDYRKIAIRTLETPRLLLRPILASDASRIQSLFSNPKVLQYLHAGLPIPYPEDGALEFLSRVLPRVEAGEEYLWVLLRKENPEEGMIGQISLTPKGEDDHRGFWLGEPYWEQGYMKEAVGAVNDFAFDELKMDHLLLNNAEPNVASHRLKESCGAEIIGRYEKEFVGGLFTSVRWKLTADAWRKYRSGEHGSL